MSSERLYQIGIDIGNREGREFECYEVDGDWYVFFFYNEFSEYVEIHESEIENYKNIELEFIPTAV